MRVVRVLSSIDQSNVNKFRPSALLVFALLLSLRLRAAEFPNEKPLFTILYTAEAHAALLPCDCPLQPLGGVARRATLIARYRARGPVLLLDGGGFAAGGLYDEESDGDPERDKLRTSLMREAMRLMKYDAVALGPSEAAIFKTGGEAPAPVPATPHTFEIAGQKIKLCAWSEPGLRVFGTPALELPTLRNWTLPKKNIDIHLSRFGENDSELLAKNTGAELVLCAGRKSSQRSSWKARFATLANFDYQARSLVVIDVFPSVDGSARYDFRTHLEPLDKNIPDDPAIAALLAPHLDALKKKTKRLVEIEYWMMPECPGCKLSRPEVEALQKELAGRIRAVPHWVVEKQDGKFTSLHGESELNETRMQVLVGKYYPEKIWDWLAWRAKNPVAPWESGAEALNILSARLREALAAGEADMLLDAEYNLAERRHISATPSLIIANRPYDGAIDRAHLLGALCGSLDVPKPDACKDAPACFADSDCRQRGFNARCADAGLTSAHCNLIPAKKIAAFVLYDDEALDSHHERIMEALLSDLPGFEFSLVKFSNPEGAELARAAKLTRLPAFLLEPSAASEKGFQSTLKGIAHEIAMHYAGKEQHWLLLREDRNGVGANRFAARERVKGRADLFVSRFSKNGQEALEAALDCAASLDAASLKLQLHDVLYWKNAATGQAPQLAAPNGLAELEESARAMAVRQSAPAKLNAYLRERGKKRGSSYWDAALKNVGLESEKIRALAEEPAPEILRALEADATLLKTLDAGGDIVLIAENCELITVSSRADLNQILERIAARK